MHRFALVISTAAAFAPAPRIRLDGSGLRDQPVPHDDRRGPPLLRQGEFRGVQVGTARVLPRLRLVVPSLRSGEREDQGPVRGRKCQVPAGAAGPGRGVLSAPSRRRRDTDRVKA